MGWSFDDEAMKAVSLRWPSPRSLVAGTFLLLAVLLPPVVDRPARRPVYAGR